ncbi:hypothetical protein [Chroococcidiopsis sp.]|uniref:hypothetical protein n=1 Tax=Chroococcidiopsis sp. TaxID=3088168 RepID=UPI003F37AE17
MIETTIKNFLNLPGVIGLGIILIQEQPRSYLCLKEQTVQWQVKEFLNHNFIRNIIKNPDAFDVFEFPIQTNYVYTYKVSSQVTLLVLTSMGLAAIKTIANLQLKTVLKKDVEQTIAIFQKLAKEFPLVRAIAQPISQTVSQVCDGTQSVSLKQKEKITVLELLNALNHLSKFTSTYMGRKSTIKYWDSTRSKQIECLAYFQMDENAEFIFTGNDAEIVNQMQHYWIRKWTSTFLKKTALILPNLPEMVAQKCLSDREKFLVFPLQADNTESQTSVTV